MPAAAEWSREFILRGQRLGLIRTDLPVELLIEIYMGMGVAIDLWTLDHIESVEDLDEHSRRLADIFRRVSEPQCHRRDLTVGVKKETSYE